MSDTLGVRHSRKEDMVTAPPKIESEALYRSRSPSPDPLTCFGRKAGAAGGAVGAPKSASGSWSPEDDRTTLLDCLAQKDSGKTRTPSG